MLGKEREEWAGAEGGTSTVLFMHASSSDWTAVDAIVVLDNDHTIQCEKIATRLDKIPLWEDIVSRTRTSLL